MPNLRECLAFLWCLSAAGQQTEQKCQFEVTSVKRSVGQIYYRRQEPTLVSAMAIYRCYSSLRKRIRFEQTR